MPDFLGALDSFVGDVGRSRGRSRRRRSTPARSPMMTAASNRANAVARMVRPDLAGAPARDAAMLPAAWPAFAFALATGTGIVTQTMNVQTAFRGQRIVAMVLRNGTSAQTTLPLIQVLTVGMKPILTTGSGIPLEIFAQNAFDTNVLLPPTVPGVIYILSISLTNALTTTDTITCVVGVVGSAVL
jgi:hypothetical protein